MKLKQRLSLIFIKRHRPEKFFNKPVRRFSLFITETRRRFAMFFDKSGQLPATFSNKSGQRLSPLFMNFWIKGAAGLILLLCLMLSAGSLEQTYAAKLNHTYKHLAIGQKAKLKLKGAKKKVVWSSSKSSVASVKKNGKVTALTPGKAVIKAKSGGRTYTCNVTVWDEHLRDELMNIIKVHEHVNKIRKKRKAQPLELNYELCLAAIDRSAELKENFSHTRPDGTSCFTVLDKYNIRPYRLRGENVAFGFDDPKVVVKEWMNSPGHRAAIIEERYEQIGVGYYYDEIAEIAYWVQLFYSELK